MSNWFILITFLCSFNSTRIYSNIHFFLTSRERWLDLTIEKKKMKKKEKKEKLLLILYYGRLTYAYLHLVLYIFLPDSTIIIIIISLLYIHIYIEDSHREWFMKIYRVFSHTAHFSDRIDRWILLLFWIERKIK